MNDREPFQHETATFLRELPRLLDEQARDLDPARFALVCGEHVSTWDTQRDAARAGFQRHFPRPFLVKEIKATETVLHESAGSVFGSVGATYEFLVDFYDAFSYAPETGEVFLLQIDRGPWDIQVVGPVDYYLGYPSDGPLPPGSADLDSVFSFRNTPYRWLPLLKDKLVHRRG